MVFKGEAENLFWYFDKAATLAQSLSRVVLSHVAQDYDPSFFQVLFDKWPSLLTQVIGLFTVSATATKKSQKWTGSWTAVGTG